MNPARISIAVLLLLASAVCASAQTLKKKKLVLSAWDKKEIVREVFNDGFDKLFTIPVDSPFQSCLIPLVVDRKVIFVATEIEPNLVRPDIDGYTFKVLSEDLMRVQVEKEKGECYFLLTPLKISKGKVQFILARIYSQPAWVYGRGFRYEFERINGNWKYRVLGKWDMVS